MASDIGSWDVPEDLKILCKGVEVAAVTVLPSQARGKERFYSPDDIAAIKAAGAGDGSVVVPDGVDVRYLHEFSAAVVVVVVLAVAENIGASGIIALGRYLLTRAGLLVRRGLHTRDVPVEMSVKVARVLVGNDGSREIDGLEVDGPANDVVRALAVALGGNAVADSVMREIEESDNER